MKSTRHRRQRRAQIEFLEQRSMLAAGAVDTTYGNSGVALAAFGTNNATAAASALQPDGKLVVAGGLQDDQHHSLGFIVARFNTNGSLDNTFGTGGTVVVSPGGTAHNLAIQPDGKILIAGDDAGNLQQNLLVRLNANGAVDPTFGNAGQVVLNGISSDFALLPGGKIISVQGDIGSYQLTRFNPNGSMDTSFGQGGTVTTSGATVLPPTDIAADASGRIIVSGDINQTNPDANYVAVTRFNGDGSLDTTFGSAGTERTTLRGVVDDLNCLAVQPDGRILAGGLSVHPVTKIGWDLVLIRYNTDGTLDTTFGASGIVIDPMGSLDSAINRMFVEPNGEIVAAGRLGEDAALYRFNSDGSLDSSFGSGGVAAATGFQHDGFGAAEQADGKYLLAGTSESPTQFAVERFTGETPPTTSGIADVAVPAGTTSYTISLSNDFTGGSVPANQLNYTIVSDTNPALFSSTVFDPQAGTLTLNFAAVQTGNALLTVRAADPDGTFVDASFGVIVGPASTDVGFGNSGIATAVFPGGDAYAYAVGVQTDGKIVEAGTLINGLVHSFAVARFNTDGSLDSTFGTGGEVVTPISVPPYGPIGADGVTAFLQPDGKLVVGGQANGNNFVLVRYNADGTLDSTFGTAGIVTTPIGNCQHIVLQLDGKIVAVGGMPSGFVVARYNGDGTLDSTFGTGGSVTIGFGSGSDDFAFSAAIQSDGKIVAAGYAGNPANVEFGLARLNANGTLDTTFGDQGTVLTSLRGAGDEVFTVAVQPDGKIIAGGISFRATDKFFDDAALVRYNTDGTLDTTFGKGGIDVVPLGSSTSTILQAAVQPDGKIVTSGTANGQLAVARFNADGSLDTTFDSTGVATTAVANGFMAGTALALQPDGKYVQAGVGDFDGRAQFVAVRYLGGLPTSTAPVSLTVAAPAFTEEAAASSQTVATFTDPNGDLALSNYQATIDWGDGSSVSAATLSGPDANGIFTVSGSHAYAEESTGVPLTVTVTRTAATAATLHASVPVADAPLSGAGLTLSTTAGSALSGPLASFSDGNLGAPASDFSVAIDWGDGTKGTGTVGADPGAVGAFVVSGSHVYSDAAPATAPIAVVVHDAGGSSTTITSQAIVSQPATVGSGATLAGTQAAALSAVTVATFTHGDGSEPAGDFSASIDWGDGQTSTGTIDQSAGTYSVVGTHTYTSSGAFVVGATISVHGGSTLITGEATIAPAPTPHQLYVESVYHDVLGRSPDASGLSHWASQLDSGAPPSSVAASIAHCDEYYANFVIKPDYLKYLGRTADDSGVSYWTTKMQAGLTDGQLAAQLVASDEFFKQAGGSNSGWIDAAYQALLGRAADASGDSYWIGKLSAGETRLQVAQGFTASVESDKAQINDDYLHYLGRPADVGGMDHWLSQFAAGGTNEDLIAAFTGSAEYYKSHSA